MVYVPHSYHHEIPAPLVVMLHGAGGNGMHGVRLLERLAEEFGFIVVAPTSRGPSWDLIIDEFGPDVSTIDQTLELAFSRYTIDPSRLAIGGFSDGASYALSLGITNGDLLKYIFAFSPGFMAPARAEGAPRIFVSHGTDDPVLHIDRCSRLLTPQLEELGYQVQYQEFEGGHEIPVEVCRKAIDWLIGEQ